MGILHILVSGSVQGVGFRAFVQRQAKELRLGGKVRNLHDGRVEILLSGSPENLNEIRQRLCLGPPHSVVEALVAKEVAGKEEFERFSIVEDGDTPWYGP